MAPSWAGQALGKDWEDPAQPPAASRRGSGAALPGASALSLHFFSGAKGRRPHTWAHTTASPQDGGFGPSDPRPHSAKCLSVSLEEVGDRRRVVQCIIFKLPNVWVGVCMKWNKLPTASPVFLCTWTALVPPESPPGVATPMAPSRTGSWALASACHLPIPELPPLAVLPTPWAPSRHPPSGAPTLASLLMWQEPSGVGRRNGSCPALAQTTFLGSIPARALPGTRCDVMAVKMLDQSEGWARGVP